MTLRQQILYLWLAESALDTPVVGWAFHDGSKGAGSGISRADPPYATGVSALEDGWFLIQSSQIPPLAAGAEHATGYLPNEFVFERRVEAGKSFV